MSEKVSQPESAERLNAWLDELQPSAESNTLLSFNAAARGSVDLTHAHPSGLAQLLAGRKTRLSTLIRDSAQLSSAMQSTSLLRAKIQELSADRGIEVGFLAAGIVSWGTSASGKHHKISAPVMLSSILLSGRAGQDDYELQLTGQAKLNPALVRVLQRQYGIAFDPQAVARLAYSTARFDPAPVLEHLRVLTATIPGVEVAHQLLVASFADLGENLADPVLRAGEGLVPEILAAVNGETVSNPQPIDPARFEPLDQRAPSEEFLILDADAEQQLVLDAIRAGESLVVAAPPGSGQTQTAMNAIATLVHDGKNVLVVGERSSTLSELAQRFASLSLDSMILRLDDQTGPQQLKSQLVRSIMRNEKSTEPRLDTLHQTLSTHRHQLLDHVASLHNVRQRWGCSPYQAMQSLAELTSIQPAPATTVRLKRSVLDAIKDRSELSGRLRRAAELGSFSKSSTQSPWYGARLVTRKETEEAHALATSLFESVPAFAQKMHEVADYAQISHGSSFAQWGEQLELLVAVRESLDKFMPDIFDRPVTDLISATATTAWRRDRNLDMPSMQRSRLRRVAKEYIRPGVHIDDLHASLLLVQEQRERWADFSVSQRHPAVPSGLAELRKRFHQLSSELLKLGAALERTAQGGALETVDHRELLDRLGALADDRQTLENLPERTLLEENMREHGLGELLDDLAAREVLPAQTRSELELAWWQSALEAMISGDDYLAMSDGENLRKLEAEYRLADQAHVVSGSARLRWQLAAKWREAVAKSSRSSEFLRNMLKDGRVSLDQLSSNAVELLDLLVPVWSISPHLVPTVLPEQMRFDAVVLLDAESIALPTALPALARAKQVIAFGDDQLPEPVDFSVAVESAAEEVAGTTKRSEATRIGSFAALAKIRAKLTLKRSYRSIDEELSRQLSEDFYAGELSFLPDGKAVTGLDRAVQVEYLADGTGLPGSDSSGVESVAAEVNRVVDLVFESARTHPRSSLAVITASAKHAARVAEAIRIALANHPELREFFSAGDEPFRVAQLDRAAGLSRDRVIFSLGFGRTPHGRALHHFGPLSEQGGRGKFALAMTRAREQLIVLSCFKPEDLDTAKLNHGALDFYQLLERELGGKASKRSTLSHAAVAGQSLEEDPLVADLADRLRARDARVWYNYDGVIDIVAAADPLRYLGLPDDEIPTPVAVESDGSASYRRMSVRERSRLRPQLLERRGWRYMPLWTIEVFTDPSSCADRIGGYLGLEPSLATGDFPSLLSSTGVAGEAAVKPTPVNAGPVNAASAQARSPKPVESSLAGASPTEVNPLKQDPAEHDNAQQDPAKQASDGLDSTGLDSAGLDSTGLDSNGNDFAGSSSPETNSAERNWESNGEQNKAAGGGPSSATSSAGSSSASQPTSNTTSGRASGAKPVAGAPLIPQRAAEDDPRSWGDRDGSDHDEWLREQKPPHWG
ncbi:ATPase AAA [Psychromicrobium lacuslunae]|uniref:ATPase AAA n=1 Tax=Psychromicrobium lacuslunae TaxID=1618207 RepID=A0A0D4C351_9MICC|nr:ATPase AAA [Psychromicrobium lacuslunae]